MLACYTFQLDETQFRTVEARACAPRLLRPPVSGLRLGGCRGGTSLEDGARANLHQTINVTGPNPERLLNISTGANGPFPGLGQEQAAQPA